MFKLYRPVGFKEVDLILNTGNRSFPVRLPEQPFFYPVLNYDYAREIAENWNTKDEMSGYAGYIIEFEANSEYISKFETHIVGASRHKELWVPAEELDVFNKHINGNMFIAAAYYGTLYTGVSTTNTKLKGLNYTDQFLQLKKLKDFNSMDYVCEVLAQWKVVTQNYFLWSSYDFSNHGINFIERDALIDSMKNIMIENKKRFIKGQCI